MSDLQQRKAVFLNSTDLDWFEKQYEGASLSWVLSLLLEKFRLAHVNTPTNYAELGAKALKEELEG